MAKNDRAVLGYIWGEDNLGYRMCAKSQLKIGTINIWSIQINEMTSGCDPKILNLWWISWTLPVWLSFRFVVSCRWKWQYTKALTNYVKIILHTDCQVPKTITGTKKKQWVQLVVRIVQTPTFQLLWVFSSLVVWQILSVNHLRIIRKTKVNRKTLPFW